MASLTLPDTSPLLPWYRANARDLPWRKTRDPYRIWVSEIMLQQTRVEAVIRYYYNFLDYLPDVAALALAPEELLLKLWEGLGYYSRVRNMQKAARTVTEKFGGVFPRTYADIRSLCGIGDYTAGAIASFAYDLPYPAVDGNVLRVASRLLAFEEDITLPAAKAALTAAVAAAQPENAPAIFNQAIMELGATVCLPNGAPKCGECPMAASCAAHRAGQETAFPKKAKKAPRRIEKRTVLILRDGDRIALSKRPQKGLLAGLFEPVCMAGHAAAEEIAAAFAAAGIPPLRVAPLGEAKHIFTHLEWHMTGFEVILPSGAAEQLENGNIPPDILQKSLFFTDRADLDTALALPSAYRAYRAFM